MHAEVTGLEAGPRYDAWLVDNVDEDGNTVRPESGDVMIHLGALDPVDGAWRLDASLGDNVESFDVDLAVVTSQGQRPDEGGDLFGMPTFFQRMYRAEQRHGVRAAVGGAVVYASGRPGHGSKKQRGTARRLQRLIADGERLFFKATFGGNGRTCGTCHRAENNFTIDPDFIATLPMDDRLFVAEPQFAESFPELQENFEVPALMRAFGLILENVDGTDDLENKFTLRGVPHTLAMSTSLAPASFDGTDPDVVHRTGWSGDGAPGDGSLRSFAVGAVRQHFTKSTQRRNGIDFRLPNDHELDALAAFQLSLGRQAEVDLTQIEFKTSGARYGLEAFNGVGQCSQCHFNAGANVRFVPPAGTFNGNFDTGVESVPHPAFAMGHVIPPDGGFGSELRPSGGFGNGTFNTTSLVEVADTGPYFHNNVVDTLEASIRIYTTSAFTDSPAGQIVGPIPLTDEEIDEIAEMLKVLNAVENIASTETCVQRAVRFRSRHRTSRLAHCARDLEDAIDVLDGYDEYVSTVAHLTHAQLLETAAKRKHRSGKKMFREALASCLAARAELIVDAPE